MITLPQGDLPKDPGILRTAAQHNALSVGVYASVLTGGSIRRGDPVTLHLNLLNRKTTTPPDRPGERTVGHRQPARADPAGSSQRTLRRNQLAGTQNVQSGRLDSMIGLEPTAEHIGGSFALLPPAADYALLS